MAVALPLHPSRPMQITQGRWTRDAGWQWEQGAPFSAQLVLAFGCSDAMNDRARLAELQAHFPGSRVVGCSTAGEIDGVQVRDESMVVSAIRFEHTSLTIARVALDGLDDSHAAAERLARQLAGPGLCHAFVLSEGLRVNGSALVKGLNQALPGIPVTGGLSGDGSRMQHTVVCLDGEPQTDAVVGIGFYGARLRVGCGSVGGWDPFGVRRTVTRSAGNVLYELDGAPALEVYRRYLGEQAADLPASALLFPLSVQASPDGPSLVRTVLGVDPGSGSMTFAGDVPVGAQAQLMKANFDRLIGGAFDAASASAKAMAGEASTLAVLISCVGRKLILKQRVEEEVESVREVLGPQAAITGFYSYGELSPFTPTARCELHNQTMTVTTFAEV